MTHVVAEDFAESKPDSAGVPPTFHPNTPRQSIRAILQRSKDSHFPTECMRQPKMGGSAAAVKIMLPPAVLKHALET